MHNIIIYQLSIESNNIFRDYEWATRSGHLNTSGYHKVWSGELYTNNLNKIFEIFNLNHPSDYRGHSLSISDIVSVDGVLYFVNDFGFVELKDMEMPTD